MFNEFVNLQVKAGRFIHRIPKNFLDIDVLDFIKWEDPGYLYKRRLAIEIFKISHGLNDRLSPFVNFKAHFLNFDRQKLV